MTTTMIAPMKREQIGRYRLVRDLSAAGTGTVFVADDPHTHRQVVLKLLARDEHFSDSAQRLTRLEHEHLVPILDAGEADGHCFLVMELLKGETLLARLKREHRLPLKEALRIGREAASALAAAHTQKIIHRDVCPENIWLEPSGRVRLLGFGTTSAGNDASLLHRLEGPGTPGYLSPEQAAGEPVTAASDLFGLGCVLYQMATGDRPFRGDDPQAMIRAVVLEHPKSARAINPEVFEALDELIARLLAKLPSDRPASAAGIEQRLTEWLDPTAPKPQPQPATLIYPASKRILETLHAMKIAPPEQTSPESAPKGMLIIATPTPTPEEKRNWLPDLIAALLLFAGAVGLYFWWKASNEPSQSPPAIGARAPAREEVKPSLALGLRRHASS